MTNALDILLRMDIPEPQRKEIKVKRLSKLAGEPVTFTIRELTFSRVAEIKEQHNEDGEMAVFTLLAGVTSPNLKDKALLEKYGAATPAELVKKLLTPGEIEDISRAVEILSGYRTATIEEVKKNSTGAPTASS